MALHLSPELEARVLTFAQASEREPGEVLAELVRDAMDNVALAAEALKRAHVDAGFAAMEAGRRVSHEEAMARLHAAATGKRSTP